MKFIKRAIDRLEEKPLLSDSTEGLIGYTNKVVAKVVDDVVRKSGIQNASRQLADIRHKLDSFLNTRVHWHNIPPYVFQGAVRERTKLVLMWIVLVISEASLNYYALSLMIAPGDTGPRWLLIRMMLALLATLISIYSAEEFFKKIFWHKRTELKRQYNIYDGEEAESDAISDSTQVELTDKKNKSAETRKSRNRELIERGIWLCCMILAKVVIVSFAIARSEGIEQSDNWERTIGLVLISVLLPSIGGLIYEKIDRLSFLIRAYRKQADLIKYRKKIDGQLKRMPTVLADMYKRVLFNKAQAAYRQILSFEALINSINRKKQFPKASRRGIEYIEDFNQFFEHIESSITMLANKATQSMSDELATVFARIPALQTHKTESDSVDTYTIQPKNLPTNEPSKPAGNTPTNVHNNHSAKLSFTKTGQNNEKL